MKHSIKRISKSALSVILALMMVVSTMVVGMVFTANAATITAWTIAGYPINSWNYSAKQITGSSGSWIFDRGESASGTSTIYFRIRCHESSNTYNYSISGSGGSSGGSLNKDTTYNLVYNTDGEMKVSVSQRYVRFTIDQAADSQTNRIKVEESATSDFGSGGETTTNLAASTKTLLVAYDKSTNNKWNYTHIWYDGDSKAFYDDSLLNTTSISGFTYYDFKDITLTPDKQINFIVKDGKGWSNSNKYGDIKNAAFVKGVQWYAYNNGRNENGNPSNAKYTPIAIKSLSTTEVTSGQDNTITFTPAGGVPYFLSDKGTSANYTLNVYEGSDTTGTQIVTNAKIANDGTYNITWNPTAVTSETIQKLTFVLSDEIDSVSHTVDYTVKPVPITQLATPEISVSSSTIGASAGSSVTLTVNTSYDSVSDANVSFELYKGDNKVDDFSGNTYKITEAGTYQVKAVTENTAKYSNSELSTATTITKAAQPVYYVGGRFRVKVDGVDKVIDWNEKNTDPNFKFNLVDGETDLYCLNTNCTLKELSEKVSAHNDYQYFKIYDQANDKLYNAVNANLENCSSYSAAQTLNECGDDYDTNMRFQSTATDGTVTLYLKNDNGTLKLYYSLVGEKTSLDAPSIATDIETLTVENPTATITVTPADTYSESMAVEYYLYNGGKYVDKTKGTTFTVTSAGTYTVKAYPPADNPDYKESVDSNSVVISDGRTPVVLEAMHGIKNGEVYTGNTVAEAANTSSSVVKDTSANLAGGIQYKVTKGSTVKLTTTMVADTTTAEKFVYAYVVNNKDTYLATEGIAATGEGDKKYATYSATFTIDEDATDTTFTVVPIYYYKACANEGKYIKFYVNPSDSSWGNNVYNYTYYLGSTTYESEGNWPGQPMLYDETKQLYYSLVPKEIKGQTVSGLTVNNNGEQQTYDFDDFKYIYESDYDIVRLDLKYRSGHTLNKTTIGASYTTANGFAEPSNTITVDTFDGRWESFNDINGNPMSLLGKEVTGTTKVYVVSTALHDMQTGGENRGKYMTSWYVYQADSNGNLSFVTAACPSDFVPRPYSGTQTEKGVNTSAYNKILDSGLGNSPVQIVFEDGQLYDSKTRIDGRWYYAQSDSEVSAYAYYRTTDSNGTNPSELFQNAAYASVNGAVSVTNPKLGLEVSVVSSPLAGYIFDHWSVVDKAGNTLIKKLDNVGASFTTTLDQEVRYVANFRKATSGQLVINHSKYTGTGAKNGLGFYRLEVQVQKENGSWTSVYAGSGTGANGQTVTISELTENDRIVRIKLITETAGENTFRYWYTTSSDGTEIIEDPDGDMTWNGSATSEPSGKNGILTYTFDTEVWKLFRDTEQKVTQLNFYSDIAPMTKKYKLTYIYDDRFGNQKTYVVTGTHDDQYFVENKSWVPTQALIYEKAPYIDDLYKDCTWTMTQCTKDGTDATLTAVQKNKKYTVDIYNAKNECETDQFAINSYVKNKAGQFYVADEFIKDGDNTKKFSYWVVKERIIGADGITVTEGKEVARHYYRKYTLVVLDNYIIKPVYGEKVEDKAYISDPQYSREQTTNADGSVVKDKLYVDFMLAYISSSPTDELISSDAQGTKYQTGILIEVDKTVKLKEGSSDYSDITFDSSRTDLEKIAKTTTTKNTYTYTNSDSTTSDRIVFNYRATNTNYNNMNRLEYFVYFNNTEANCSYVMKAYYYVIVDGMVILSDPVFFNLYEVGNSAPNTVTTTS